jgi:hypothetical protein
LSRRAEPVVGGDELADEFAHILPEASRVQPFNAGSLKIIERCQSHPDEDVMSAAEAVF